MGNSSSAGNEKAPDCNGDSEPSPIVDGLESFVQDRFKDIEEEFPKLMEEARKKEQHQRRVIKEQEEQIIQLKRQLDATRDSRIRNRDIRPGDLTHEDVKSTFVEYFNTPQNVFLPLGINKERGKQSELLTNILQVTFLVCQHRAVEILSATLNSLLEHPEKPVTRDFSDQEVPEEWRYKCEAFSILLSLSKIDPHKETSYVTELVKEELEKLEDTKAFTCMPQGANTVDELVAKAAKLAWEMITLVPPAILGTPNDKHHQWQTVAYGSDESKDSKIVYHKPIFFFSARGGVGEKGEIELVQPCAVQSAETPAKQQGTELPEETAKMQKQSTTALTKDEETKLQAGTPGQQQGSTEYPQQMSEECETANKQEGSQETGRNDTVLGLNQVSEADGLTDIERKPATDVPLVHSNNTEDSKIEKEDKKTGLAAQLLPEHTNNSPASMEPASGKEKTWSDTCSGKRSDLLSQNGSDNDCSRTQSVAKKNKKKNKKKEQDQNRTQPDTMYEHGLPPSEVPSSQDPSKAGEAKNTCPNLP